VPLRAGAVYPVALGRLQDDVGTDLDRAERAGGIGGEERVAGARREDHDPPLLQVPDGAAADVGLRHRAHLDRGEDPGLEADLLEPVLEGERVDDGGQHTHVVGGRAIHPARARGDPPEDVAAADDDGGLDPELGHAADLPGDPPQNFRIDSVAQRAGQRLARKLQNDAAVRRARRARGRRHAYALSPTWKRANRLTTTRSPVWAVVAATRSLTLVFPVASLMNGCSSRQCSAWN